MPLNNWIKCNDEDLKFTRKNLSIGNEQTDDKVWISLQDEYLSRFGLNEDYKKFLTLLVQKAKSQLIYVETSNRFELNKITQIDFKLNALSNKSGNEISIQKMLNHLSKMQGYTLTKFNTTVSQYFELIDTLKHDK